MRRDVDRAVEAIAARHAGAFTAEHVRASGGDRFLWNRRTAAGHWVRGPGEVFVLAGTPPTFDLERHVALLAAGDGAVLSHESAAELHGLRAVRRGLVVVTVGHPLHLELPGTVLHQLDDVAASDRAEVDGWPTTTPARTIVDLAGVLGPARLQRAVEHAIVERLATYSAIDDVLRRIRRRGKPGVRKLVAVLADLGGEPPPASELERLLWQAIQRAGVDAVRQFPLPWAREPVVGVVDCVVPRSLLILEADGRPWHSREEQMANDRRRDIAAAEAGYQTLRFVGADLEHDLPAVAGHIRTVHDQRLAQRSRV